MKLLHELRKGKFPPEIELTIRKFMGELSTYHSPFSPHGTEAFRKVGRFIRHQPMVRYLVKSGRIEITTSKRTNPWPWYYRLSDRYSDPTRDYPIYTGDLEPWVEIDEENI